MLLANNDVIIVPFGSIRSSVTLKFFAVTVDFVLTGVDCICITRVFRH